MRQTNIWKRKCPGKVGDMGLQRGTEEWLMEDKRYGKIGEGRYGEKEKGLKENTRGRPFILTWDYAK